MAYSIIQKPLTAAQLKRKAPHAMKPEYITIHNTYNDATALSEISYMANNSSVVGYHVAIDDKHVVEAVPFTRNTWHAGDSASGTGNRKSIGIEICYSKNGGNRYYAAEANAVTYTANLLSRFGWGIDRIRWHRDWSGKNCPHRMIAEGRLDGFKRSVQRELNVIKGNPTPIVPTPSQYPYNAVLTEGVSGAAVKRYQTDLNTLGYPTTTDGHFGPGSERSTKAFQKDNGLAVDGIGGPATQQKLVVRIKAHNTPKPVKPTLPSLPPIADNQPKGDKIVDELNKTQRDDMVKLLKYAYDNKIFSVDHTSKVPTMTRDRAMDLIISYVARTIK